MENTKWTGVIGLMSGTSLDGLDICYVEFANKLNTYQFRNLHAETITYSEALKSDLKNGYYLKPTELDLLDLNFGNFLASKTLDFIGKNQLSGKVALIASHGHTIFHQPKNKITVQIGSGKVLHEITRLDVINDFRIKDVLLGGQGAPLVPVGDHYLFSNYQSCLNLGGFSNISFTQNGERIAFDISPCNLPINQLCKKYFKCEFDHNGTIAESGKTIQPLLESLNALPFYSLSHPKSLGYEWLEQSFQPELEKYADQKPEDLMRTVTEHVGFQISETLRKNKIQEVLVTGGGAYNEFLISILKNSNLKIVVPEPEIIEFKEALIFAFLGYLNLNNSINTFKSVTGASEDSIGGIRHFSSSTKAG